MSNPVRKPGQAQPALEPTVGVSHNPVVRKPSSSETAPLSWGAPRPAGENKEWPKVRGYQILDVLGRGGMGVVYKARHTSLNRVVALKMVLAGSHAGETELSRFRIEAEAVARLQHPNIVQIYEVGEQDNQPYFSLEFVDGGSLAQKCNGQPQPTRQAAALVESLARAMDYAHQQGIVHRDLKPANILLTSKGMPKITDFGLAKRLESNDGETKSGAVLGTPSYIAPEQAAGKIKEIGPCTDVYALGTILYELLTGRPPFRGETPLDTMLRVMTDEPVAPSLICNKVPRDLETICQKCLHKEPAKRYASARALAEDLRRFLTGESIQARPVGTVEKVWRWSKRRPLVAGLMAALMMVMLFGIFGVTWQWRRAENLRQTAEANAAEAIRQKAQAEQERVRAEENFRQARKVVDEFFTKVSEEKLLQAPGLQPLRKELLDNALKYYQKFAKEHGDKPGLRANLAGTYQRVGLITREIGSNNEALAAHQKALELREQLARATPNDAKAQQDLAETYLSLGYLQADVGQPAEAQRSLQKAQQILEPLILADPGNATLRHELGMSYDGIGRMQRQAGQYAEALGSYERCRGFLEQALRMNPSSYERRSLAACCLSIAYLHRVLGQPAEALRLNLEARDTLEVLVHDHPGNLQYQGDLAGAHNNIGMLQHATGKTAEALQSFDKARAIYEELARANPTVIQFQQHLVASLSNVGNLYRDLNRSAEALRCHQQARDIMEKLVRANPSVVSLQHDLARVLNNLGNYYFKSGQASLALENWQQSRGLWERFIQANPTNHAARGELGQMIHNLARVFEQLGKREEAVTAYQQAIEHQKAALASASAVPQYRASLNMHYTWLCRLLREMGRPTEAAAHSRDRRQLNPDNSTELYATAGDLALCVPLVSQEAERRQLTDESIQTLRQAIDRGFADGNRLRNDANFNAVRNHEEFRRLQARLDRKA